MKQATLSITVGGPAAGKSTIAKRVFVGTPIVDSDEIKKEYADYDPARPQDVHVRSSEEATRRLMGYLSRGESVVFDSTGTNPDKIAMFASVARASGMRVEALFVTCNLETALLRAEKRERKVPLSIVREKHSQVASAFLIIKSFVDSYSVIENN